MNWQLINEIIISKTKEKIQSSRTSIQKSMRNSTKEKKPIILWKAVKTVIWTNTSDVTALRLTCRVSMTVSVTVITTHSQCYVSNTRVKGNIVYWGNVNTGNCVPDFWGTYTLSCWTGFPCATQLILAHGHPTQQMSRSPHLAYSCSEADTWMQLWNCSNCPPINVIYICLVMYK